MVNDKVRSKTKSYAREVETALPVLKRDGPSCRVDIGKYLTTLKYSLRFYSFRINSSCLFVLKL